MADPQHLTPADLPEPRRAPLRLVRGDSEELGPVSPELALVSPELAAAVRPVPDALFLGGPRPVASEPAEVWAPPAEAVRDAAPEPVAVPAGASVRFDTPDLVLERHGLTLELRGAGARRSWRLTLARGETVEARAEGDAVPERIELLLRTVVRGEALQRVPTRSTDAQVRRLEEHVEAQLASLLRHDAGVRLNVDPENLHQLRVASRRLRAFLRVGRDLVDHEWSTEIGSVLRDVGQGSGRARDADVLIEHLREQLPSLDPRDCEAVGELIGALERERDELQADLLGVLDSPAYAEMLDRLALPVEPAETTVPRTLERRARRELRSLIVQVRALGRTPPDEKLHALRLKVKRVRYATEVGGLPGGGPTARVVAAATALQDLLGDHHDAVVAEERIRALAYRLGAPKIAFAAGRLAERQRQRRDELERRLPAAWRQLRRLARKTG